MKIQEEITAQHNDAWGVRNPSSWRTKLNAQVKSKYWYPILFMFDRKVA